MLSSSDLYRIATLNRPGFGHYDSLMPMKINFINDDEQKIVDYLFFITKTSQRQGNADIY